MANLVSVGSTSQIPRRLSRSRTHICISTLSQKLLQTLMEMLRVPRGMVLPISALGLTFRTLMIQASGSVPRSMKCRLCREFLLFRLLRVRGRASFEPRMAACLHGVPINMGVWPCMFLPLLFSCARRQLGLGSKVTVEAVTVPTEVALWRIYPDNAEPKCTSIAAGKIVLYVVYDY